MDKYGNGASSSIFMNIPPRLPNFDIFLSSVSGFVLGRFDSSILLRSRFFFFFKRLNNQSSLRLTGPFLVGAASDCSEIADTISPVGKGLKKKDLKQGWIRMIRDRGTDWNRL
jgi:hypothetical protein